MTIESQRKRLLDNPRRWGERVSDVLHTPRTRENSSPAAAHHDSLPLAPPDLPLDPPDPPAKLLDPIYQIPIPANTTMISTKGWTLDSLINQSINFHRVPRVSALSGSLPQYINDHENSGVPLVIEDCHRHPNWSKTEFTLDSFASASPNEITVRNVHGWQDTIIPLSEFITKSRSIATFAEEGEQERFYGKDAQCPKRWEEWLRKGDVVPQSLLCGGPQDFFRYRPQTSPIETLMCYLGVGDTFTPCHKDLCSSSGQNLMCHTENNGSSFWFMTETASAPEVAEFFHSLGRELDHEDYVITVQELSKAHFKVYILEQKLGDLVLVPPRSAHQVVNFGGITVKTSWSRMTLKGLVAAYHYELPIYRRVCRLETYQVKSTIRYVLLGLINDLRNPLQTNGQESLASNIRELLAVFDRMLAEEECDTPGDDPCADDIAENIVCDCCGADVFQGFFECRKCNSAEGGYVVCPGCYAEGRSCKHQIMQPMQRRPFKSLLDTRTAAIEVVDMYESRYGRTFQPSNDYCDINNSYPRTFRAAIFLLDTYKKMKSLKVCTLRQADGVSHVVRFSWALSCKMCHHAKCFSHILSDLRIHSVEALLLHSSDDTHQKYHHNHTAGRKARFPISMTDLTSSPLENPQLVYYATHFTHCKPIKPQFLELGWYDANAHISDISDDQESSAEKSLTVVPHAVSISTENGPIVVQPPPNDMPEITLKRTMKSKGEMGSTLVPDSTVFVSTEIGPPTKKVKRTMKARAYVLVPDAQYRYRLPDQDDDTHPRSQVNSSTSALSVTRDPQDTVERHEQRASPLQLEVNYEVPQAPILKSSTLSLSDIGISIPTTVRKSGSFILHTPEVPRNPISTEETVSTEHPVEPVNPTTRPSKPSKPPHVANRVTTQVITKRSLALPKFNRSKPSKLKPKLSSSNNTTTEASTLTQGGPNLPQSQPTPPSMPLPEPANVSSSTGLTAQEIAEAVIHRFGFMLCQNTSNPEQPMNSFDTSSYNSHPQQHCDPPLRYNGPSYHCDPPQQHTGQSLHYNGPSQHHGPSQQHTGQHPNYNGPSQHYGSPPHFNSHEDSSRIQYSRVHPQGRNPLLYHAPLYPKDKQPPIYHDDHRPPQRQIPVQSASRMGIVNHESQDHHNGRKMPETGWFKQHPNKKRKFKNSHQQARYPRIDYVARSPQGPRGRQYNVVPTHSTSQRVEYHDDMERSTSRDHVRSPWGTNSDGTPSANFQSQSEYFQREMARGRQGYRHYEERSYPQRPPHEQRSHPEKRSHPEGRSYREQRPDHEQRSHPEEQSHPEERFRREERSYRQQDPETSFIQPKIEVSTQNRMNSDATMDDVIDVDSIVIRLDTSLPMADPTFPSPHTELEQDDDLYPNDSAMDTDHALHEAGTPTDNVPVPVAGDQGRDQDWEDCYAIEEPTEVLLTPASAPQLAIASAGSLDSIFNAADDTMADVTANPWTSL